MRILGIDYGQKKIGLALADSSIAEPYKVIRFSSEEEMTRKVEQVVQVARIEQIVVGVSEGEMGQESKAFGKRLEEKLGIPVHFQDETLTTHEAQELSLKAGIKRKKRKEFEDAFSAALTLQSYLDSS